jgi:hypothetical protein
MCPNGNTPSGTISDNNFINCPGIDAIYANPNVKNCSAGITLKGNKMDGALTSVVRYAVFDKRLDSRMPLVHMPARLKLLSAYDQ